MDPSAFALIPLHLLRGYSERAISKLCQVGSPVTVLDPSPALNWANVNSPEACGDLDLLAGGVRWLLGLQLGGLSCSSLVPFTLFLVHSRSNALIQWAAGHFLSAWFVLYEQIHPGDPFGRIMQNHFSRLQSPLRSLTTYPDCKAQRMRFLQRVGVSLGLVEGRGQIGWPCLGLNALAFSLGLDGMPHHGHERVLWALCS